MSVAVAIIVLVSRMASAQNKLSPQFRSEALRALDAIEEVGFAYSSDWEVFSQDPDATNPASLARKMEEEHKASKRQLEDAKKAVNEAKYKATASDKDALFVLQEALQSLELQGIYRTTDPRFRPYNHRFVQCMCEAVYLLQPGDPYKLTREQVTQAKLGTCAKKTAEWPAGWWK